MFSQLTAEATSILSNKFGVAQANVHWHPPAELKHGDATTNIALQIAKGLKKQPRDIASVLAGELKNKQGIAKVEVAGAGYVNVWLTPDALLRELNATREALTPAVKRKEPPVIVEYSQPNIAKPLGVHHIIGTMLGQAIVNLYRHAGYHVVSWNYIGDWGTQFGKLAVAYEQWGKGKKVSEYTLEELLDLYVRFHQETEKDQSLEDAGREAFRKLEQGDKNLRNFWKDVVSVTKTSLEEIYHRLHVSFDTDLGESFYEDKMQPVIEEGKKKGVFTQGKEGALIAEFPQETNLPPYLILKGDGATLYSTRDLAQMRYRIDTYHPQAILILTDIAQKLHFEQLVQTCGLLGWELPAFENVLFGRMRFADKSMSTRKGNVLKLEHVLDEAVERANDVIREHGESIQTDNVDMLSEIMGVGALVYGMLSQNRKLDLVFDWDKMLSFEGNSAPYLQYTHARARSVIRKGKEGTEGHGNNEVSLSVEALTDAERALIHTLLLFPSVLTEARESRMPHKLANFLYQLSQAFNAFYNSEPILKAEGDARALRLSLTDLTSHVLRVGAELLTLRVPERM